MSMNKLNVNETFELALTILSEKKLDNQEVERSRISIAHIEPLSLSSSFLFSAFDFVKIISVYFQNN